MGWPELVPFLRRRSVAAAIAGLLLAGALQALPADAQQQNSRGDLIESDRPGESWLLVQPPTPASRPRKVNLTVEGEQAVPDNPALSARQRGSSASMAPVSGDPSAVPKPVQQERRQGVTMIGGLHLAASHGQLKALEQQLKVEGALNRRDRDGNTALMLAVAAGKEAVVRRLLKARARMDLRNNSGESALVLGVRSERIPIVELLVEAGALRQTDENTRAIIERDAVRSCKPDLIRAVVGSHGSARRDNELPLSIAAAYCDQSVLVEMLTLSTSAKGDVPAGHSAMFQAIRHGNKPAVELLLGQGVMPGAVDGNGTTPLSEAAMRGRADLIGLLVAKGANVNHMTDAGNTPLMFAAHAGAEKSLRLLIGTGANLDLRNRTGLTALMIAARAGHAKIADLLIAAGANSGLRNSKRETAVDLARAAGHDRIAKLLR